MFCENCGQNVADGAIVCKFCGQTFAGAAAPSSAAYTAPVPPTGMDRTIEDADAFLVLPASRTVLGALERGSVIRKLVALALRVVGILIVLAGIYFLVQILKLSFQLSTQGTLGGLIYAVIFVAGIFAMLQICFYRAGSVSKLDESPFPVMSVISILFRASGEIYAVALAAAGLGGCLFIWFSGMNPMALFSALGGFFPQAYGGGGTFLDGVEFLISMVLAGFASLFLLYFMAEVVLVLADIAKNVRLLVKTGDEAS